MSSRYTYCSNTPGKTSRNQRVLKIPIWKSHYQLILAHVNVTKDILLLEDRPLFFISYLFCSWNTIWQKLHGIFSKIITQVARITQGKWQSSLFFFKHVRPLQILLVPSITKGARDLFVHLNGAGKELVLILHLQRKRWESEPQMVGFHYHVEVILNALYAGCT